MLTIHLLLLGFRDFLQHRFDTAENMTHIKN